MKNRSTGFSLIELLIAISVVGLILIIAIPQYSRYNQRLMLKKDAQRFEAFIREMRQEALKRGCNIDIKFVSYGNSQYVTAESEPAGYAKRLDFQSNSKITMSKINFIIQQNGTFAATQSEALNKTTKITDVNITISNDSGSSPMTILLYGQMGRIVGSGESSGQSTEKP